MKKRFFLLALFFSFVFLGTLFPQENLQVSSFEIQGLKRTKRSYMDGILNEFLGQPASEKTLKAIETKLQAQNLFDQIKVSAKESGEGQAAVEISFKEKWSILPFPVGYYTGDTYGAGLFLMDMNALGQHCMATVGGMYSSSGMLAAGVFQKPPAQKGKLGFSVLANVSKGKHEFANSKNQKVFDYENFYVGGRANLLFKPTNSTTASVGAGYSFFNPIDSDNVQRRNQWSASASWEISASSWNGFFLSVNSFNVGTEFLFSDVSEQIFAQTFTVSGEVQQPLVDRLRLVAGGRGFFSNNLLETNYVGRGSSGVTLLPSAFATDQIFGMFAGFEAAVVKAKFGVLSIYGLYEVTIARELDDSIYACSGPEMGLRLYLAKFAFPAFAMGVSYNINEDRFQYSFSGGASF